MSRISIFSVQFLLFATLLFMSPSVVSAEDCKKQQYCVDIFRLKSGDSYVGGFSKPERLTILMRSLRRYFCPYKITFKFNIKDIDIAEFKIDKYELDENRNYKKVENGESIPLSDVLLSGPESDAGSLVTDGSGGLSKYNPNPNVANGETAFEETDFTTRDLLESLIDKKSTEVPGKAGRRCIVLILFQDIVEENLVGGNGGKNYTSDALRGKAIQNSNGAFISAGQLGSGQVGAHEIGHLFGLGHTSQTDFSDIMNDGPSILYEPNIEGKAPKDAADFPNVDKVDFVDDVLKPKKMRGGSQPDNQEESPKNLTNEQLAEQMRRFADNANIAKTGEVDCEKWTDPTTGKVTSEGDLWKDPTVKQLSEDLKKAREDYNNPESDADTKKAAKQKFEETVKKLKPYWEKMYPGYKKS